MNFIEAQSKVVKAVVAALPPADWQAAILDLELREQSDGFDTDFVGIVLVNESDGELSQEQFRLDRAARKACRELYLQRKREANETVAGFVLRVEQSGAYRFDFKHAHKRLNGEWDAESESYLDNYLDHYLRERSATPDT